MSSFFNSNSILVLFLTFLIGVLFSSLIISSKQKYKLFININFDGPQKIHDEFIPRFGGISFFLSILFCTFFYESEHKTKFYFMLIACFPAFMSGICEDVTNLITPKIRLFASFLSAILFIILFEVKITHVGISFIDYALGLTVLSVIVSVLSISILIQGYNLIDGLNGLAIINFILLLLSVLIISYDVKFHLLTEFSICLILSILGVFIFNFPFGKIFLGDGGAYVLGAISSFIIIILTQLNENIQPATALLLIVFPLYELLRSFFRRSLAGISTIFKPDDKHLHSVVYKSNLNKINMPIHLVNSISTIQISIIPFFSSIWACFFYNDILFLYLGIIISILLYELIYFKIQTKKL